MLKSTVIILTVLYGCTFLPKKQGPQKTVSIKYYQSSLEKKEERDKESYHKKFMRLKRTYPIGSPELEIIADVRYIIEARYHEEKGRTSSANKAWFEAVKISKGKNGEIKYRIAETIPACFE